MANNESTSGITSTINDLQGIIKDRSVRINKIEEDIHNLKQAIQDIDKAKDYFRHSAEDIKSLEYEVGFIFKGRSADAFLEKVTYYKKFCNARIQGLDSLRSNYQRQIDELEKQKLWAERINHFLQEALAKLRSIEIQGK